MSDEKQYLLILDNNYFAGFSTKYADMYNISGGGREGAAKLSLSRAQQLAERFASRGFCTRIEEYDAKKFVQDCLDQIVKYGEERENGKSCGYAIRNVAKKAMHFLSEV